MSKHPRADLYMEEREKGMTLREIADKHGVSYQAVASTIYKVDPIYHKTISKRGCIYPNLRRWLNENQMHQIQFFSAFKCSSIRDYLKGYRQPKKDVIDTMLKVTGMTYEEMFAEEEEHG